MQGLILILVFGAVLLVLTAGLRAKRHKDIAAWASSKGLSFDAGNDRSFDDRYPEFRCLRRGRSRSASHIAEGDWNGRRVTAFDYRYVTGEGKSRSTHHFSAAILRSEVPLKPLYIRSEHVFDKVTEFLGIDDIDFESAVFSREFHVKSPDKRWAYDVIHQRTMEFLLAMPRFSIEFGTRNVMVWRNRRFKPSTFEEAIAVASGILDRLPDYLLREMAKDSKGTT